jgi:hypothetical protein
MTNASTVGRRLAVLGAAAVLLSACGGDQTGRGASTDSAQPTDSAQRAASTGATPERNSPTTTVVTFDGIGRARIGASLAQLREGGAVPDAQAGQAACRFVKLDWLPAGTLVMLANDTVARIDVDSTSAVRTIDGAAVGDTEARLKQLYPRAETQPHKYVSGGHYVSVSSPNDSTRRLVFETDGKTVKTYRVGRRPEVDFVERCG